MKIKFFYLTLLSAVIFSSASAQLSRGNVLIGANLANLNLNLDRGGNFAFQISPKAAWFIKDNFAIGAYLMTGLSTAKDQGTDISYGVGSLARYYFRGQTEELINHSRFFVEGNVGIEGNNPAVGDNTNGLGLGIGPGWTYFITSNIGLEALLKYNGIVGFGSKPTSNNLNLSVGFQIYLPSSRVRSTVDQLK